jgi:hypothetical protein
MVSSVSILEAGYPNPARIPSTKYAKLKTRIKITSNMASSTRAPTAGSIFFHTRFQKPSGGGGWIVACRAGFPTRIRYALLTTERKTPSLPGHSRNQGYARQLYRRPLLTGTIGQVLRTHLVGRLRTPLWLGGPWGDRAALLRVAPFNADIFLSGIPDRKKKSSHREAPPRILGQMRASTKTSPGFAIRCGTPDCDWGFPMPDLSEPSFDACYADFQKHCVQRHGLTSENTVDHQMHLDLVNWVLTLIEWE